ncbi:hypothetical protein BEH_24810 (plasmid) [Priestia filamentosa]|uniref:Uncharacterized protein n=1 Tax=Priestia filamentosa TaxID=1402861 RepID=A0A2L1FFS6_9BACI|nr:hypothetical protein [Priestia filamentosa]AVD54582.1 hypothetical protein CKF96_03525 [Priestia filamentosa]AWG44922.1 hypothetical protein BEH_24810 [Priestia filamentosa]
MKNHEYRNGRLIQTNKEFSALTKKQKDWIQQALKERYIKTMKSSDVKLKPNKRDQILEEVYDMIEEKDIWIPFGEVKKYYYSKISSFIRSHRKQHENLN